MTAADALQAVVTIAVTLALVAVARTAIRALWPPRRKPSRLARTVDELPDEHERPNGIGAF